MKKEHKKYLYIGLATVAAGGIGWAVVRSRKNDSGSATTSTGSSSIKDSVKQITDKLIDATKGTGIVKPAVLIPSAPVTPPLVPVAKPIVSVPSAPAVITSPAAPKPAVYVPIPIVSSEIKPATATIVAAMKPLTVMPVLTTLQIALNNAKTKYPAGTLLRAGTDSRVYQMDTQGYRHWITTRSKFDSLHLSMASVKTITLTEMNAIPVGSTISGLAGFNGTQSVAALIR
jgi:hypothetical protein